MRRDFIRFIEDGLWLHPGKLINDGKGGDPGH